MTHPMRRKQDLVDAEKQTLEYHATQISLRLQRFFRRALVAFAILGLTSALSLFAFGIVLKKEMQNTKEIQKQRHDFVLEACLGQNNRNISANDKITEAIEDIPPGTPERERAEKSSVPFREIINATVPFTSDCEAYTNHRVRQIESGEVFP